MKKITYLLFAFLLIATSTLLAACSKGEPDEFWTNTYAASTEIKEKQENKFVFDKTINLTYSAEIEDAINQHSEYSELTDHYETLLKASVEMFVLLSDNLALQPANTKGKVKNIFAEFDAEIKEFDNAISTFLAKKTVFENSVVNVGLTTDYALLQLRTFKVEFKNLLKAAESFNNGFEKLFLSAYISLPTKQLEQADILLPKLYTTLVINQLTKAHITYVYDNTDTVNRNLSSALLVKIIFVKFELTNPTDFGDNLTANINNFIPIYEAFTNELSQFYTALDKVDLFEYTNTEDKELYAKEKNIQAYLDKIDSFINETTSYVIINLTTNIIWGDNYDFWIQRVFILKRI